MLLLMPLRLDEHSHELYGHFVPKNHRLRQMHEVLDFSFILPLVAQLSRMVKVMR